MAQLKSDMLRSADLLTDRHRVLELDALAEDGPDSLAAVINTLDHNQGVAIITEGLMSYLDPAVATALWQRIATQLKRFPQGVYISDGYVQSEVRGLSSRIIKTILQRFVSGRLHTHYDSPADAQQKLTAQGFSRAQLHAAKDLPATRELALHAGGNRVRVVEAWSQPR